MTPARTRPVIPTGRAFSDDTRMTTPLPYTLALLAALGAATSPAADAPLTAADRRPDAADTVKGLQEKRVAVLKEVLDATEKAFTGGQAGFDAVVKARLDLLQARLDAGPTRAERLRLLEEVVKVVKQAETLAAAVARQVEAKTLGRVDALKAQAFVLQTRIALEQARAAKEK